MKSPEMVIRLPRIMTMNVNPLMRWSAITNPNASHFHGPSWIRPGLKLPVMVVYLRRVSIQRCIGMIRKITSNVRLASEVACP